MSDRPRATPTEGKLIVAANPWWLAAEAKRQGYDTDRFREADIVSDDKVFVFDLDAIYRLPETFRV